MRYLVNACCNFELHFRTKLNIYACAMYFVYLYFIYVLKGNVVYSFYFSSCVYAEAKTRPSVHQKRFMEIIYTAELAPFLAYSPFDALKRSETRER